MFENEIAGTARPAGWDAATIYTWLMEGAGPEATTDRSRDAWEDIARRYDGVRETVRQALRDGQVAFEGEAGDAMAQRVEPLAGHADTAQQAATSTADAIGQQGSDFRDARNQVVPPVAVPDKPFLNDLAPWETDYDEAKAGSRAADEHDIRVLSSYGDATRSNIGGLPQFEQPPSVTPQLDIPSSSTAQVSSSSQPAGGAGGAAGGPLGVGGQQGSVVSPGVVGPPGVTGPPGGGSGSGTTPPGGGSAGGAPPPVPACPVSRRALVPRRVDRAAPAPWYLPRSHSAPVGLMEPAGNGGGRRRAPACSATPTPGAPVRAPVPVPAADRAPAGDPPPARSRRPTPARERPALVAAPEPAPEPLLVLLPVGGVPLARPEPGWSGAARPAGARKTRNTPRSTSRRPTTTGVTGASSPHR